MLHAFAGEFFANFGKIAVTNFAFIRASAHFNQCVRSKRQINLMQHRGREAVLAHHYNWVEVMRGSPQRAAGARRKGGNFR